MIQNPQPGEVLVAVPRVGALLDLHSHLNPVFGGILLRGKRLPGNSDAVEWALDGHDRASASSASAAAARVELARRCERAMEMAHELEQAIKRTSRDATMVKVPPELLAELGARTGAASLSVGTARALQEALPRAARAVRRAAERGDFAVRDGRAKLFGWCFLPGHEVDTDSPAPQVQLEHSFESLGTPSECHRFRWAVRGVGRTVRLVVGDAAPVSEEGTERRLQHREEAGEWRLPLDRARAGDLCRARVRWSGGEADSAPLAIPAIPLGPRDPDQPDSPPPPPDLVLPPGAPVSLDLRLEERLSPSGSIWTQRMDWQADGSIESVELVQVDLDQWRVRAGPDSVESTTRDGSWIFEGGVLAPGTEYLARALGPSGEVLSNRVRIPERPPVPASWWTGWGRGLWQWWALWGPCAWCSRMGLTRGANEPGGCCPPGCLPVGCTGRGCLSAILTLLLLLLLAWLLRSCSGYAWSDWDGGRVRPPEQPSRPVPDQPPLQPPPPQPVPNGPGEFDPGDRWGGE